MEPSKFIHRAALFALLLTVQLISTGALAANACLAKSGGIGGTGAVALNNGIGGTGTVATGGGIGGTGIVGIITGFASICVNGIEVHFSTDTPLEINGHSATASDLAVGQLVMAEATGSGDEVVARNISVQYAVLGPVDAINAASNQMRVMGQSVQITGQTVSGGSMSNLHAGDYVRVSGLRKQDGNIVAARIDRIPPQKEVSVTGPVNRVGGSDFSVSGLNIAITADKMSKDIAVGREVRVTGPLQDGVLQAQTVDVALAVPFGGREQRLELQGYVNKSGAAEIISVGKTVLEISPQATINGKLEPDQLVRVSAHMTADHRLVAERIEITHDYFERIEAHGENNENARNEKQEGQSEANNVGERMETPEKDGPAEKPGAIERVERIERIELHELSGHD